MKQPILIKIGSNVLRAEDGTLDLVRLKHLVEQIVWLKSQNESVVVVSSGAVASGKSLFPDLNSTDAISQRQLWASIGQVKLIETYSKAFSAFHMLTAQVLVTKEDFRDRSHYLNMKNCFSTLLENQVVPIVNENDVISVTELMFTDNDELAGLVASMLNAKQLILLTNVDGVFTGNPSDPNSKIIHEIAYENFSELDFISPVKSNFGRGGMLTKFSMARKTAGLGIPVTIGNGRTEHILRKIYSGESIGSLFKPKKRASTTKKWLAHAESAFAGAVTIDEGAEKALQSNRPTSLLFVGIKQVEGNFRKGDIIRIQTLQGKAIGLGKASYDSETAQTLIGKKHQKECIHYDYLYLNH